MGLAPECACKPPALPTLCEDLKILCFLTDFLRLHEVILAKNVKEVC